MRSTVPLAALAATAMVFVLSGCGGASSDELSYEDSPLSEYLSAAWGSDLSPEEQQKKYDEQQVKVEELISECMSEEGFEYVPNTSTGTVMTSDDTEWEPDKREWVEKYGYGYVNSPFADQ